MCDSFFILNRSSERKIEYGNMVRGRRSLGTMKTSNIMLRGCCRLKSGAVAGVEVLEGEGKLERGGCGGARFYLCLFVGTKVFWEDVGEG